MRVNIIGCAPGWEDAPFGKGPRWGINDNHTVVDGIELIFDCHNLKRVVKGKEKLGRRSIDEVKNHLKIVKKKGIPMYSTSTWKNIPNIMVYPLDEVVRKFDSDYFGGGPDYAIAFAVLRNFTEIHLYGIIMVTAGEYYHQAPSCEHWIGVAKGAGVKVVLHDRTRLTPLLKTPDGRLYGYNTFQKWRQAECDLKQ